MPIAYGCPMTVEPVVLEGPTLRLEPMTMAHVDGLWQAGQFKDIWRWDQMPVYSREAMEDYVSRALQEQHQGRALPLVTVDRASGQVIGSSRFGNIDVRNHRLEIGWTWLTPAFQRTRANTEAKLLMLTHAFDTLEAIRVEFKANAGNTTSRNALVRLGATQEGIFRDFVILPEDGICDYVYYSIIRPEWPDIRRRLEDRLAR